MKFGIDEKYVFFKLNKEADIVIRENGMESILHVYYHRLSLYVHLIICKFLIGYAWMILKVCELDLKSILTYYRNP